MDRTVFEPEPKVSRGWSRTPKFEFRLHSPGFQSGKPQVPYSDKTAAQNLWWYWGL